MGKLQVFNLSGKMLVKKSCFIFFANSNKVLVSVALQVFT